MIQPHARANATAGDDLATTRGLAAEGASLVSGREALYLQVTLNQQPSGQLARFFQDGEGRLSATVGTLRTLGFSLSGRNAEELVDLQSIDGLQIHYDAAMQAIALDAPLSVLSLQTTRLGEPLEAAPPASASPGLLLNYGLYAARMQGIDNLSATTELRAFGIGAGVFRTSAAMRVFRQHDVGGWHADGVRLDSSWQLSFPDRALSLTLGDANSDATGWSRSVHMGGIRIGRDFGLQPYRVTAPLPAFLGQAAVPSTVDLYINGMRQYSGQVPPGPFQLTTVPGITGSGNARIVVTDAYGRATTLDIPFYATQQLLAAGLSDWGLSVGRVRENYGLRSFDYADDTVASGSWRYGLRDDLTLEAHAEAAPGLANLGAGARWLLGRAGVLGLAYARSDEHGARGGLSAFSYDWNNGRFNLSLQSQRSHGDYRDIATRHGLPPASVSERAFAGINLGRLGNASASYVRLDYPGQRSRYAGLFWNSAFSSRLSAHLSFNQNLDDASDRNLYFGLSLALDDRRQGDLSWQGGRGRGNFSASLSKPVPGDGDAGGVGWRVQARSGDDGNAGLAEIGWLGPAGRYAAGWSHFNGVQSGYASADGSLVWMGGRPFAARGITDAFALISTNGIAGVPVKLENRLVGHTGRDGLLLVTPLRSWQRNQLAIDPMELPANMRIAHVQQVATPRDRAGVRVDFGLSRTHAALVVLHDPQGRALPVGSTVDVAGQPQTMVGYDGEVYLDDVQSGLRLQVSTPDGSCTASVDVVTRTDVPIPRIGPIACRPERSP